MSGRHSAAIAVSSALLLGLTACTGGEESNPDPAPPSAEEPPPELETDSTEAADVGQQAPAATTRVVLGGGAMGGAPASEARNPTVQEVADTLYENGLQFTNGVIHNPDYVYCEGAVDAFECYIQVSDIAPYWIDVMAVQDEITFDFAGWADA